MITKIQFGVIASLALICFGLFWRIEILEGRLAKVQGELAVSREAARQCSEGVAELQETAKRREKAIEDAIRESNRKAKERNKRADRHLATPGIVPGDSCASAKHRLNEWWQEQGK